MHDVWIRGGYAQVSSSYLVTNIPQCIMKSNSLWNPRCPHVHLAGAIEEQGAGYGRNVGDEMKIAPAVTLWLRGRKHLELGIREIASL